MGALRRVGGREAIAHWAYYEALFKRVLDRLDVPQEPDDVLTAVQNGAMQLWRIVPDKGCVVTEIQDYPKYRLLLIFLVAGEHARDWLDGGDQQLVAFAQSHNCKYIEFQGREGWEPHARAHGFTDKRIKMRKRV